jgi:hypothetical protein
MHIWEGEDRYRSPVFVQSFERLTDNEVVDHHERNDHDYDFTQESSTAARQRRFLRVLCHRPILYRRSSIVQGELSKKLCRW